MTKVGLITVGQAPRSDVVPDMAAILGGDVLIVEAGALDGLTREQIAPLAPEGDDEILVTRLADGSSVFVGKTRMIPRIEAKIAALEDQGVALNVLLCTGEFPKLAARRPFLEPHQLLLDEPLGALDKKLRDHMKIELKRLQREVGITTIYVTHDQEEALTMSDRIAVMHRGRVEQVAAPRGLYETPATAFVAGFIGNINLLAGRAAGANAVACGGATLAATGAAPAGAAVAIALRPERVRLDPAGAMDTLLTMTVAHVVYQGETVRYILRSDAGLELQALELGEVRYAAGARVRAGWAAADARMIEDDIRREEIA